MNLSASLDRLDRLINDGAPREKLRPLLSSLRENLEAMEPLLQELTNLKEAFARAEEAHEHIQRDFAKLTAQMKMQHWKALALLKTGHLAERSKLQNEIARMKSEILQLKAQKEKHPAQFGDKAFR